MTKLPDDPSVPFKVPASEGADSPRYGFWGHPECDDEQDVFVLRDIVKQEDTMQGVLSSLIRKTLLSGSSRNPTGTYTSCKNMVLAAVVVGWTQKMRDDFKNFLNYPDIKRSIEKWRSKIARGEHRPVLEISRPLPNGIDMDMLEHFIGYYDTGRFTCNLCVLVTVSLLLEAKPKG